MRIEMSKKRIYGTIGACVVSLVALACGGNGASNNDQGVSVTFLGLFNSTSLSTNTGTGGGGTAGQQGCGRLPAVFLGGSIQLGTAAPEPGTTVTSDSSSGIDDAGSFISVVGVQNNLYGQVFRGGSRFYRLLHSRRHSAAAFNKRSCVHASGACRGCSSDEYGWQ